MNMEKTFESAVAWMINRGWKRLMARRRERFYPERSRRKQSLFEHTMMELDTLLSLLPIIFLELRKKTETPGILELCFRFPPLFKAISHSLH